jgi:tetratricopeptide (TPR) repeat protein
VILVFSNLGRESVLEFMNSKYSEKLFSMLIETTKNYTVEEFNAQLVDGKRGEAFLEQKKHVIHGAYQVAKFKDYGPRYISEYYKLLCEIYYLCALGVSKQPKLVQNLMFNSYSTMFDVINSGIHIDQPDSYPIVNCLIAISIFIQPSPMGIPLPSTEQDQYFGSKSNLAFLESKGLFQVLKSAAKLFLDNFKAENSKIFEIGYAKLLLIQHPKADFLPQVWATSLRQIYPILYNLSYSILLQTEDVKGFFLMMEEFLSVDNGNSQEFGQMRIFYMISAIQHDPGTFCGPPNAVRILIAQLLKTKNIELPPKWTKRRRDAAIDAKNAGNQFYVKNFFKEAIVMYSWAISVSGSEFEELHILYSNRAQAKISLKDLDSAEKDLDEALKLKPSHDKSLTRLQFVKELRLMNK